MMTKLLFGASLAAALVIGSPSFAQNQASQSFLKEAIEGNLAAVQMGELAKKNGGSEGVRSMGQTVERDHNAANQKAIDAASSPE